METRSVLRVALVLCSIVVATGGLRSLRSEAAPHLRHCPRGVQACSASQVGRPCNPNNLNVICSVQENGSYCCLAYAR